MADDVSRETPPTPAAASVVFGDRVGLAEAYWEWLAGQGTVRGLIGPREVPRLWDRHLLNCAILHEQIADGANVADIGSGAGLPGVCLAIARPDLRITLIEPLLRRVNFLKEVVADLALDNVAVSRGRAEDWSGGKFDVVTSRAVAPMERLAPWSLPLCRAGGQVLAIKGDGAASELTSAAKTIRRLGGKDMRVLSVGEGIVYPTITVVRIET